MAEDSHGPLDRATLTSAYLDGIGAQRLAAGELTRRVRRSELLNGLYHGRYLSRPLFLGPAEHRQLDQDLQRVHEALRALTTRLCGDDFTAFASAMGLAGYPLEAVSRSRAGGGAGPPLTSLARADLYTDQRGFRLLEFNTGSAVGGMDNPDICRAMLSHPALASFSRKHGLRFADTGRALVETIITETGLPRRPQPVVALANWPAHYERLAPYMRALAGRWQAAGLDTRPCHLGQLRHRAGRLWLGGSPVDLIYRMFPVADLARPEAPILMEPVLAALAAGAVRLFTPLETELLGSKAALAALASSQHGQILTTAERSSVRRLVPWTTAVLDGPAVLENGTHIDLLSYAITHQDDLVIKPVMGHSGEGVLTGWARATTPDIWRDRLRCAAADGGQVIQRRIRPAPELFPDDRGSLAPWIVVWGAFRMAGAGAGYYARAVPQADSQTIINRDTGAAVGGCLVGQH